MNIIFKGTFVTLILILTLSGFVFAGNGEEVVNLYTNRHYDTDQELLDLFTEETGIKVNVLKGDSDQLIEKIDREGADTSADLLVTADAGRLHRAKVKGILQPVETDVLAQNIADNLRDEENYWYALTVRGRVIVYARDRVDQSELSTYGDLVDPRWDGRILVRSSANIYNQSLLASLIAVKGADAARDWAAGVVRNMARKPRGNDRAQATAVVAGIGDIAIMNTYYIGKMLNSSNPEEVKVAEKLTVFFPDQETTGTHINVSGIGLTKYARNKENAVKLMEFLTGPEAQKIFAEGNYEYPANTAVEPSDLLKSWGDFKPQNLNLTLLGEYNEEAVRIFNQVGWQ